MNALFLWAFFCQKGWKNEFRYMTVMEKKNVFSNINHKYSLFFLWKNDWV